MNSGTSTGCAARGSGRQAVLRAAVRAGGHHPGCGRVLRGSATGGSRSRVTGHPCAVPVRRTSLTVTRPRWRLRAEDRESQLAGIESWVATSAEEGNCEADTNPCPSGRGRLVLPSYLDRRTPARLETAGSMDDVDLSRARARGTELLTALGTGLYDLGHVRPKRRAELRHQGGAGPDLPDDMAATTNTPR